MERLEQASVIAGHALIRTRIQAVCRGTTKNASLCGMCEDSKTSAFLGRQGSETAQETCWVSLGISVVKDV